jgi:nucleotide-binding universal stress UspA family protein
MRRIVVGFDGSEHARKALERAAELAGGETSIAIVSAAGVTKFLGGGTSPIDPADEEARATALDEARSFMEERGIEAVFVRGTGNAADVILEEAEESGADLIIIGTRGNNVAKRLLLGTVSTNVVHHAPCDVLIVR